jgi:metallo-beta-lactamase class B
VRQVGIGAPVAAVVAALSLAALPACAPGLRAQLYSTLLQDNRPRAPFEIATGLFYVGSSDIAVFAIRTPEGLILIDGGYESTAPQILANLRALGLDPRDVRILLNTHAHMDHAGGLAELKRATGARLYASPESALLLEAGGRGDFFLGDSMIYEPVAVDRRLADGERVTLGGVTLTAHFTPGHTKGCTSWSLPIAVDGRETQALIVCSLSTLAYRLEGNRAYPDIVSDYRQTYRTLRALPCELFLGDHAKFFDLERKRAAGAHPNPFVDPEGCRDFVDREERKFLSRL